MAGIRTVRIQPRQATTMIDDQIVGEPDVRSSTEASALTSGGSRATTEERQP